MLPETLAARVRRSGAPTARLAQTVQTALAIEIFLMTGLRIANVAELEIGRTLILRGGGGVEIQIPRESVKNRAAFAADLPAPSARLLREYLRTYRPLVGDAASPWLIHGARPGTQKSTAAVREQVTKAMASVAGVARHPHLFRHLLAHLQLSENRVRSIVRPSSRPDPNPTWNKAPGQVGSVILPLHLRGGPARDHPPGRGTHAPTARTSSPLATSANLSASGSRPMSGE